MKTAFYLIFLTFIFSCNTPKDEYTMENIDQHLQSLVDKDKTPSVSYLLFNKDSILHSFSSGYADILNEESATEHTTYSGFSVTKTFTALSILQLAEKGKLTLEDKVVNHVNDFPYSPEITIHQLLTHSAGIPNPLPIKWVHSPTKSQSFDRNEFFNQIFIDNPKVKSDPNEKFSYSNLGYFVLGQVIENISGLSYEEYVHQHIISPLGINKKELDFEIHREKPHAKGYQKKFSFMNLMLTFLMDKSKYVDKTEGKWISFYDILINGPSHGGLIGTPNSFMKYVQELLNPNSVLLSEEYKQMLFNENLTNSNKKTGMCLSWFKGELNGVSYYSHAGGGAGYYCEIRIYPEKGIGNVIMFNRTGISDERILDKIDIYYFGD